MPEANDNIKYVDASLRLIYGDKPVIEMQLTTVFKDDEPDNVGPTVIVTDGDAMALATDLIIARLVGRVLEDAQ